VAGAGDKLIDPKTYPVVLGSGRVSYVVHVAQSNLSPHMVADRRYYKRFNFESVCREEYEVRDIANRQHSPDLSIEVALKTTKELDLKGREGSPRSQDFPLELILLNESPQVAEYRIMRIYLDKRLTRTTNDNENFFLALGDERLPVIKKNFTQGPPNYIPIWQGERFVAETVTVSVPLHGADDDYYLLWIISAPGMASREGLAVLKVRHDTVAVENIKPPSGLSFHASSSSD
jgi:hypothetical protein